MISFQKTTPLNVIERKNIRIWYRIQCIVDGFLLCIFSPAKRHPALGAAFHLSHSFFLSFFLFTMVRALLLACLRQSNTTSTATTTTTLLQRPIVSKLPAIRHVSTWRVMIRPYYYNQPEKSSSLSKALRQQRNPFRQFQRRLDNANPNTVLYALLGVNGAVFLAWQYAVNSYKTFGDGRWLNFMAANFMNSTEAFKHGRFHTLLTSSVSHQNMGHLGLNMLVLYSMGQAAIEALGASRFLLLYSGAGIAASLATLAYRQYIRPILERKRFVSGNPSFGSLGASGTYQEYPSFIHYANILCIV